MNDILLLILIILIVIILVIVIYFLLKQNHELKDFYEDSKHSDELNRAEFNNLLLNQLNGLSRQVNDDLLKFNNIISENTTNHLNKIQSGLNTSLVRNFETTQKLMNSMAERMTKIDEAQKGLKDLSNDIVSLENILKDKKTRGIFGEVELYSILEDAFGLNNSRWQRQYKLSNGLMADAVIFAPKPLNMIVIDSKFPLENFNRIYDENLDKSQREAARKQFKVDVTKHINDIANKYIIADETAPIAYMFIPAEAIFAEIYAYLDDVVEISYAKKVYLVSPTTLMAYITAIKSIFLGQKRDESVAEMQKEFNKLAIEFNRYKERYDKVAKDFEKLYTDFNSLNNTSDKIVRRFEEINSVSIDNEEEA